MKNFLTAEFCSWTMPGRTSDIVVEGLKPDHKLSFALNGKRALANCRPHTAGPGAARYHDARAERCH
jgi:hypothetical protein